MKIQQLRFLIEVVDSGLNVTLAAERLFTSQPGVSKQIRLLEEEAGVTIFERSGKRFTGLTAAGEAMTRAARRVLLEAENFKRVADEFRDESAGTLTVATTHTQARYVLPRVVAEFTRRYPQVRLAIREGDPHRVVENLQRGEADIGIATEALASAPGLVSLPAYSWHHLLIAPAGHPLLAQDALTLQTLASHPLITYDPAFSGRSRIDEAFRRADIEPNLVLTAVDSDVIKTYVSLGLGVGIIASMAFDSQRDSGLVAIDVGHLFGANITRLALRRGALPRRFAMAFVELLAPQLTPELVSAASREGGQSYDI
ncbi:CysB family HTH-type transcriptional regulator [Denitratisoma oestradiolicum]|uniref:HTH-type transcriptional regulator SsuR n=1 Tax=Denitratisoma oestradiolicum TaxID=311182 RepID=A0A6S6Y073_9PROT|nr:CysB family HTH-type transcriptional regulator [Denitratisoma oestradiolicum]TWO81376.1 transcriptional regulator CysB [Denitratisoma oestradiolicum]CAB1368572.1 HTH-type transcriptional regulator SsuR [Denitratisoma oestradiolicum]